MSGDAHSVSRAVTIPSRPNGVLNHGMPAYGYKPNGVSVSIMCRSALDRLNHRLRLSFELTTRHSRVACAASVSLVRSTMSVKRTSPCGTPASHLTDTSRSVTSCGWSVIEKTTALVSYRDG